MLPAKASKIDPSEVYPCPCHRKGRLCPIVLTDALGCDLCHHIFVVRPDGYTLEQLSSTYPYKRTWYWAGRQWQQTRQSLGERCWFLGLGFVFFLLIPLLLCIPLLLRIPFSRDVVLWIVITLALAVIPAFIAWASLWRR